MTREIAGLEQEEYMYEKYRDNKYLLINLDTEVKNNDSITKIWLCKVMPLSAAPFKLSNTGKTCKIKT